MIHGPFGNRAPQSVLKRANKSCGLECGLQPAHALVKNGDISLFRSGCAINSSNKTLAPLGDSLCTNVHRVLYEWEKDNE